MTILVVIGVLGFLVALEFSDVGSPDDIPPTNSVMCHELDWLDSAPKDEFCWVVLEDIPCSSMEGLDNVDDVAGAVCHRIVDQHPEDG